ncbi:hypothetical protein ACL02S_23270 [Nocardia sp. 004]|uniref:hypothetical protein n=1 Tax=Nocardia sp. 004 TaxID=3385978 RepID=UPI00399F32AC
MVVPAGDRQKLDVAEQVRSVDPCGFFDQARISTYGQISTLGPSMSSIGSCEVGFLQADEGRRYYLSHVIVDMDSYPPNDDDPSKQIAGETVTIDGVRSSDGDCAYKVPLRFPVSAAESSQNPDIIEVPTLSYASVRAALITPAALGCELVENTVTNMVTMFRENRIPRREALVDVPLPQRSPCELMQHLPSKYTVDKFDAETQPYDCKFFLKSGSEIFGNDLVSVGFRLHDADRAMATFGSFESAQIAGKPVLIDRNTAVGEPQCAIRFPAGAVVDGYRPGTPATESTKSAARSQPMVALRAQCRVTDDLAPIAMELFGANK